MGRVDTKGKRFEFLIKRIDDALSAGFYVEAMALTYSLMEERTNTLLDRLQIHRSNADKLYQCLMYFKNHIANNTIIVTSNTCTQAELTQWLKTEFIDSNLVDNIQDWRTERNAVTHDLAKQDIEYSTLKATAQKGRDYFRKYTALIMRLKKMVQETN